jgi:LysM repeat protein
MNRLLMFCVCAFVLIQAGTVFGESEAYIVKKGDTLSKVSRDCDVPVAILKSVNRVGDAESLVIGQKLTIPEVYVVKKGDTLYGISHRYGVRVEDVVRMNNLSSAQPLKISQKIYVVPPAGKTVVESTPVPTPHPDVSPLPAQKNTASWPHPGTREIYDGKMHGVLITGGKGDLVYSVSKGRIIWAGPYRGFGNVVLVSRADGLIYGYLGFDELVVSVGEDIESGSSLGRIGVYFHQTDAKLLFFIYDNGKRVYLDPREVLSDSGKLKG